MGLKMNEYRMYYLVVILLATIYGIHANVIDEEYVITLDHSNFTQILSEHDFIVVAFTAPWCDHCKKFAPEYEKAASELSKNDPSITLAKIDASDYVHEYLAKQYNIQGIPTLKIFREGGKSVQKYVGPRNPAGIVKYVKKQLGPSSTEIKSTDDASDAMDPKKIFILGVFREFTGVEFENFIKVSEKLRSEYNFGHMLQPSLDAPLIRLFKPFDDPFVDFKNFAIDAIEKFIEEENVPSVVEFDLDPSNVYLEKIFSSRNNTKVVMLLNFSSENAAALKSKFYDIAVLLKGGNLSFLVVDLEPSKPLRQHFKLEESQAPLLFVHTNEDKKYLKPNVEEDQIVQWFKKVLDGKVEQYFLSEPIPMENNEPVKVVVRNSLQDTVFNSGKQVLPEFYAPWCGYCQKLAPILDEVAQSYENDPNVLIAKFDATANDVPSETFEVRGFPTLFFITGNKKIISYDGGREKVDFITFIEENRSDKKLEIETETEISNKQFEEQTIIVSLG